MINPIITLPNNVVSISDNQIKTTSLKVAEHFGKRHTHVLRSIENLECSPEFTSAHFWANVENQQVGTSSRDLKHYEMTKDGFMFLVMGFTGKKAAAIKEAYINAFNEMEKQMREQSAPTPAFIQTANTLTPAQQRHVQNLVSKLAGMPGNSFASVYRSIKDNFHVGSYKDIPQEQYGALCLYLGGVPSNATEPQTQKHVITVDKDNLYCLLSYVTKLADFWNDELDPVLTSMRSPLAGNMNEYRSISNVIAKSMLNSHFSDRQQMKLLA